MDKMIVGIAEGKVARGDQILVSYALGSCVGICLYDRQARIAGMAHIILPGREFAVSGNNAYKFADEGVRALAKEMGRQGAVPSRLTAKIAGGARMFGILAGRMDIGEKNVETVKRCLALEGIRLIGEDTGRNYGRTITFYAKDGILKISTVRHADVVL